jgi:hypothetical protein
MGILISKIDLLVANLAVRECVVISLGDFHISGNTGLRREEEERTD